MNEKIKMVVDLCTPTAERRPTTIEDIYDDFKVLEFNSKKELANELARMSGYKNLKEFKQELVDEGIDLDDYDFGGDALDKICQYFLSAMSDPGDGSPNIQYISINGKPVYEDYWMTYDTLSDNMDLLAHGSEEDIIKYYLKYEYDYIEDEDLEESFKSKDIGGGMENMEKVDFKKCPYCGSSNISVETNPDDTGDITENRFIPVDVYCNDCERAWMANAEIVLKEFTIYYDKWDEELDEPLSLAEGDVIPTILLDEQGESLEETLFKSNDKYSVLREAPDKLDKVYSNKSLKESAVYNYIVRYDGWVEPLYITSINPFDLGKKKDAYKFNSFDDAFNAWEELCKDPKFRESITNDTDRTIFKLREALDKLDREDGRDKVK